MKQHLYSYTQQVEPQDIDELNHVNNVVYVQWIQDAAVQHWNSVAPEAIREKYVWVIVRHEIDYKHPAKLGDEMLIQTQVLSAGNISSDREVKIFRKHDMRLLVQSKTTWCMIHADTQRPVRITPDVKQLFLTEEN